MIVCIELFCKYVYILCEGSLCIVHCGLQEERIIVLDYDVLFKSC